MKQTNKLIPGIILSLILFTVVMVSCEMEGGLTTHPAEQSSRIAITDRPDSTEPIPKDFSFNIDYNLVDDDFNMHDIID